MYIYYILLYNQIFSGLNDDEKNEQPKDMREDKDTPPKLPTITEETPEIPKEKEEDDLLKEKEKHAEMTALEIIQSFDNIKVFFITGDFNSILKKKRFNHLFNRIVFSNVSVHLLDNPEILSIYICICLLYIYRYF